MYGSGDRAPQWGSTRALWGLAVVALALLVPAAAGAGAGGAAAAVPRTGAPDAPDLTVTRGSISLRAGKVTGSFVVRNQGAAPSPRSAARVEVTVASGKARKRRQLRRLPLGPLAPHASKRVRIAVVAPAWLAAGAFPVRACVGRSCRLVGKLRADPTGPGAAGGRGEPFPAQPPESSVPTDPIPFQKGEVFSLADPLSRYWAYVPASYDSSHQTPVPLFVWLHGCEGESAGDIHNVSPGGAQDWISIAPGGEEGGCWNPNADGQLVLAAIADIRSHFNVAPRRIILGGYSSGGDLAYRLGFEDADQFAGLLVENTTPFRDTGLTQTQALADATWKFNVVHLAHLQDGAYPIAGVREETDAMSAAGFPLRRIEVPGHHYDEAGAEVGGEPVPGTEADVRTYLLPRIDDGWLAP
jgi:hypothetical protein